MNTNPDLVAAIFDQFVRIAMLLPAGDCLSAWDRCNFDYGVERVGPNMIMTVTYSNVDRCCRVRCPSVRLDYTNICYEDLCDRQWLAYLGKAARMLLAAVCPPKPVSCLKKRECRKEPECWRPKPCCDTTIITKCAPPPRPIIIQDHEEYEECDECVPVCPCKDDKPPRKVIIRHVKCHEPAPCQSVSSSCCNSSYTPGASVSSAYSPSCSTGSCSSAYTPASACTPTSLPPGAVVPGSRPTPFSLNNVQYVDAQTAANAGLVLAPVQFGSAGQTL